MQPIQKSKASHWVMKKSGFYDNDLQKAADIKLSNAVKVFSVARSKTGERVLCPATPYEICVFAEETAAAKTRLAINKIMTMD